MKNMFSLMSGQVRDILERAMEKRAPNREELIVLLELPSDSFAASLLRTVADFLARQQFGNRALLLGQIGIETAPCPGACKFCAFGQGQTVLEKTELPLEEILVRARAFAASGDLYALFLMTMHTFDLPRVLRVVQAVRMELPPQTQIVLNVGDVDVVQARELSKAGVNGAYHVCRLREGIDTALDPAARLRTLAAIREAGLDLYYCCEPIGPEHSAAELADQLLVGIEFGCFQHAAMRRVYVPGAPLAAHGQISELRLAQVVAVVTLASLACARTRSIAVHEPNLLGLASGANTVYAETGANPRDTEHDTSHNRGLDMAECRRMLFEAGFTQLLRGDASPVTLDFNYLCASPP